MKFSESWLRQWVDPGIERTALLEQLTMAGLEVDGTEPVAGEFSGVVVGEVLACEAHPDADKLSVCIVSDGGSQAQVVCGAPNVRAGLKVAFARVGAALPGDFQIRKAKLRGVESQGMLCSADELAVGEDADGIMELPQDAVVGTDLRDALDLDDLIVDLDLTPNRGDCLSLTGVAREVGVLNNAPVSFVDVQAVPAVSDTVFPVAIEHGDGCPQYVGRVIEGINPTAESPAWMVERLRRCGLRAIDPVVDVTNYVMIELGQPMHAFDLDQLTDRINVRRAKAGETLDLLDGKTVDLSTDTLMITDGNGPVAIAGVMGGARSGVQPDTRNVLLEAAFFAPLAMAGTARGYAMQTDASHRFERGVDHGLQCRAMERATRLLIDVVGGTPGPLVETVSESNLPPAAQVTLRERRLHALLGVEVDTADVDEALERLHFNLVSREADTDDGVRWTIDVPSHRFDIAAEVDLVEEVARIYGYNRVASRRPLTDLALRRVEVEQTAERQVKEAMKAIGYQEVISYSFVDPSLLDLFDPGAEPVRLENPMSSEQSVMRTNLLPGLVKTLTENVNRQQSRVRLFELGQCFVPTADGLDQSALLGGLIWGRRDPESWAHGADAVDFFDVKGDVERLLEVCGTQGVAFEAANDPLLHPGQAAAMSVAGQPIGRIGRIGRLHPEIEQTLDISYVYVFEVRADAVMAKVRRTYRTVSRFPSVRRDLALLLDRSVTANAVESVVREVLGENLTEFRLFDLYQGKGIDSNEKSIAIGLTFQHASATLTEAEIGTYTDQAVDALSKKLGARLR